MLPLFKKNFLLAKSVEINKKDETRLRRTKTDIVRFPSASIKSNKLERFGLARNALNRVATHKVIRFELLDFPLPRGNSPLRPSGSFLSKTGVGSPGYLAETVSN